MSMLAAARLCAGSFVLSLSLLGGAVVAAPVETRTYVIGNMNDGYGIDTCLASGAPCGQAAAAAFCRTRDFPAVASFAKVERVEVTGTVTAISGGACRGNGCQDLIAIVCKR
jgi:hypothetical protein